MNERRDSNAFLPCPTCNQPEEARCCEWCGELVPVRVLKLDQTEGMADVTWCQDCAEIWGPSGSTEVTDDE